MTNETRIYVPKLLAVRNVIATPQSFGMNISDVDNLPYFQAVELDRPLDNEAIARLVYITQSELLALSPAFNVPAFILKKQTQPAASCRVRTNLPKQLPQRRTRQPVFMGSLYACRQNQPVRHLDGNLA